MWHFTERGVVTVLGAGLLLGSGCISLAAIPEQQERHFKVKDRPLVVLQNIVDGRIEVKSWKNPEVVVTSSAASDKVAIDVEQVGDRIDINASSLVDAAQPHVEVRLWELHERK